MTMNSVWTRLASALLVMLLCFGLAACGGEDAKETQGTIETDPTDTPDVPVVTPDDNIIEKPMKTSAGLLYENNAYGNSCYVIGLGTCQDKNVIIPEKSDEGKTVIGISENAFADKDITSIDIPDTVKKIGAGAFDGCTDLKTIRFFGSERLWNTILTSAEVTLPENVSVIFSSYCTLEIEYLYLDETPADKTHVYTYVNNDAFAVEILAKDGYRGDAEVTGGIITDDMTVKVYYTKILANGTCGDTLTWHVYEDGELRIEGEGTMYDYINEATPWTPFLPEITYVTFADNIDNIGAHAFAECTNIERIELPAALKSVGASAFKGWTEEQTVQFSGGVNILMMADAVWNSGSEAAITFLYGLYEQDGNLDNGKEPIEWSLVTQDRGAFLLTTVYALDFIPYHNTQLPTTWETCDLRNWLANDFKNGAFTAEEKAVQTTAQKGIGTADDTVFILSSSELSDIFEDESMRLKLPTVAAKPVEVKDEDGNVIGYEQSQEPVYWWLRDSGAEGDLAQNVSPNGSVNSTGVNVSQANRGVTLAVWVKPVVTE